jgi:ADP-heptose:LPS heptosyltransferase
MPELKRILFVTSNRIGDAILTTGLLDHLLRSHPQARFTVVCGPAAEGVFARMPRRDATYGIDKRRFDLHWLDIWRHTAGTVWDLAVDLRGSALTFLLPVRRRRIMRGGGRSGHRILHLGRTLGLDPAPMPVAWTNEADRARAALLLPPGPAIVALGPTANWDGKIWPAERFVALFHALAAGPLPGARVAVLAGPGEAERARAAPVLAALPEAIDLAGHLTLPEASACLARCALFVGNDSGLMHLAAATGTPTLGLFGPTPASEYAPVGRRTAVALARGPAGMTPITQLEVADALAAATTLLAPALVPEPA